MTKNSKLSDILPYDYDVLLEKVQAKLKQKRYEHVLRVADTAVKLAKKYDADETRAKVAGIVHDYAKQLPSEDFKQVIVSQKLDPELLDYNNGIWHGVIGPYFIQRDLQIYDPQILSAVAKHTIAAPRMSKLDKIIFIADFIEPKRDFPGVADARKAADQSLNEGVVYELKHTIEYLIADNKKIYPKTIDSYNAWISQV